MARCDSNICSLKVYQEIYRKFAAEYESSALLQNRASEWIDNFENDRTSWSFFQQNFIFKAWQSFCMDASSMHILNLPTGS